MVERVTSNDEVAGSIPSEGIFFGFGFGFPLGEIVAFKKGTDGRRYVCMYGGQPLLPLFGVMAQDWIPNEI